MDDTALVLRNTIECLGKLLGFCGVILKRGCTAKRPQATTIRRYSLRGLCFNRLFRDGDSLMMFAFLQMYNASIL